MKEVLDYAKANPGKLRVGHSGIGSLAHIAFEDLTRLSKVEMTQVPFEGASPLITALFGGHIEAAQAAPGGAMMGHLKAGKVKFLASYEPKRMALLPEVPTLKELGYDVIRGGAHYFVAAPKSTPGKVIDTLYNSFKKAVHTDSFQRYVNENAFVPDSIGLDDLKKEMENEHVFFREFLKSVKIQ